MAAIRFLLAGAILFGWSLARGSRLVRVAEPTRMARLGHRRGPAARRRHGDGRLGRADRPVRDRRPAHRHDAGLGRGPRRHLPGRTAAAARGGRDRRRLRRVSRSSSGRRPSGGSAPWNRPASRLSCISPIAWARGFAVRVASGAAPGRPLVSTGRPDAHRRARARRHGRSSPVSGRRSTRRRSRWTRSSPSST